MAIETTYFSGTSSEANNLEVTTWLTANATEYFDKIIGGDVMEDIYYIVSNETANVTGNYTLNGNNYYSDGYVMIAD